MYTGKERDREVNEDYFGARLFDSEIMRWTSPDPWAGKYPSMSPYAYSANNPIRYLDTDGREFTEAAWKWVNQLVSNINKRQAENLANIAQKQAQINAGGLSEKKLARLLKQIDRLNNNTVELENVRSEITTLAVSTQIYDIRSDNSLNKEGEYRSGAAFNFKNGNFEMTLGDGSLGSLSHELKHAFQFETAALSSGYRWDGIPFYDKTDEWEAYVRGTLFGGEHIYALPSVYDELQDGPMDANKLL